MRVVMISDSHVDGLDDPVQARLVSFLDHLVADRLYILGDLFHRWWEWDGGSFPDYAPVVDALGRASARGIAIFLLVGNHDFRVGRLAAKTGIQVADSLDVVLDHTRFHLAHGDQVDGSLSYRATRAFLRGRIFAWILGTMSPERAWSFLGRLAAPPHDPPRPSAWLVEAQRRYAEARIREGAQVVVLGHSHGRRDEQMQGGRYVNIGAFDAGDEGFWVEGVVSGGGA